MIVGVFLMITCTVCGYVFSMKYVDRRKFFSEFLTFNKNFKSEIIFSNRTLGQILDVEFEGKFFEIIKCFYHEEEIDIPRFLSDEEVCFLRNYLEYIGKTDKASQENFAEFSNVRLTKIVDSCIEEEKRYKNFCVKMGFLIGLIFFIAFI